SRASVSRASAGRNEGPGPRGPGPGSSSLATLLPLRPEHAIGRRGYVPRRVARIRDAGGIGYDDRELRSADRPGRDDRRVAEHDDRQLRARSAGPGLYRAGRVGAADDVGDRV